MIKEKIKYELKNNILCLYYYRKAIGFFNINLIKYRFFLRKVSKIDSIKDFELFKNKIQKRVGISLQTLIQDGGEYGEEAKYYGHYKAFCKYAGWAKEKFPLIQRVEHGIQFGTGKWLYNEKDIVYACQGVYRKKDIHDRNPQCPIFILGPYIHYADDYWGEKEFEEYKNQIGKTLLVFPDHSCEGEETVHERSFASIIYDKYAKSFSTILVCVYWNDVNDDIVTAFRDQGAVLVSAGFRGDFNFIRRLRTIIKLADAVVVDNLGTNIGYCMYFNKPIYLEGNQRTLFDNKYYTYDFQRFKDAFYSKSLVFSKEQMQHQRELYEEFWGGEQYIRSPRELYNVFDALREVYRKSGYKRDVFRNIFKGLAENREIKFKNNSEEKNQLLKELILIH